MSGLLMEVVGADSGSEAGVGAMVDLVLALTS